ncbi:MAG: hypothetical protein VKJ64_15915 [Leptolyngbyaceae bacterium]|nr:hypothetical protein [Leptolyngbyaceae bacterium]
MTSEIISSQDESEVIDLEDELVDFTADLLSLRQSESVLSRLFHQPTGTWTDLRSLLDADDCHLEMLETLQKDCDGVLRVTWLNHPELDQGYCLILFYLDALNWNQLALYNKARLEQGAIRSPHR